MDVMDIEDLVPEEVGGICGMIAPVIAYIFIGIAILINRSWFSWSQNALSDLGGPEASYANVFNMGLVVTGIIGFLFAMAIFRFIESKIGVAGVSLFTASMIFFLLIGIFPEGTSFHFYIAIAFYILAIVGVTLIGVDQLIDWTEPIWGVLFISITILSLVSVWLVHSIPYDNLGLAIPEFMGSIPIMILSLVWGARLFFE
ncbi:MAG: DUF998 domain-containing protein [Thermoplasmata archaeon]